MKIVLDRRYLEMIAPLSKFIQNHLEGLWLVDQTYQPITGLILMLHILPNPIKLHPKDLGIKCIQFHHTVLLVLFFIITSVWRQRSLFVFDDGNQFGWKDIFLDVEYILPCWKSYTYQFPSRPSSIYKAQSRKQNRKAWDRCPLSLGGKFGKHNCGLC